MAATIWRRFSIASFSRQPNTTKHVPSHLFNASTAWSVGHGARRHSGTGAALVLLVWQCGLEMSMNEREKKRELRKNIDVALSWKREVSLRDLKNIL